MSRYILVLVLFITAGKLPIFAQNKITDKHLPSIEFILKKDGTIEKNVNGSFDAKGYMLINDPGKEPRFAKTEKANILLADPVGVNGQVHAIAVFNGWVFVGGLFSRACNIDANNIAAWNGHIWLPLGAGSNNGVDNAVETMLVDGSTLWIGGSFNNAGGAPASKIAKWDGSNWSALSASLNLSVLSLAVDGDTLFVGGSFTNINELGAVNYIAKYSKSGNAWFRLTDAVMSVDGTTSAVKKIIVDGNDLYCAGSFTNAGGSPVPIQQLAKWNRLTGRWIPVVPPVFGTEQIKDATLLGGKFYIGGQFFVAAVPGIGDISNVLMYDPSGPSGSNLAGGTTGDISAVCNDGANVYFTGNVSDAGGLTNLNHIVKWNGISWDSVGSGVNASSSAIYSSGGNLYIGGQMTFTGEWYPAQGVARWTGSRWVPLARLNLSGTIRHCGIPISGIIVNLTGDTTITMVTGADGTFRFDSLYPGKNYVITPVFPGYEFNPPFYTENELPGDKIIDFTRLTSPYISAPTSTNITAVGARLGATVTCDGDNAIIERGIVYSTNANPTLADSKSIVAGNVGLFATDIAGLLPNTTYHFRGYGINSKGTSYSNDTTFTTLQAQPVVTTQAATGIGNTFATLNGLVNANNSNTNVTFEYGTSIAYGNIINAIPNVVSGSAATGVNININGLASNTTYHFRCIGVSGGGTANGADLTFTTLSDTPVLAMPNNNAVGVSANMTLSWNPLPAVTYNLQLSSDSLFGSFIVNVAGLTNNSFSLSGLNYNKIYYWRVNALGPGGLTPWSAVWQFTTTLSAPNLEYPEDNLTNISINTILRWFKVPGATSYKIQCSKSLDFSSFVFEQDNWVDTLMSVPVLDYFTKYYWRVLARNGAVQSAWSAIWNFITWKPGLEISPAILDFGTTSLDTPFIIKAIIIKNTSERVINILNKSLSRDTNYFIIRNNLNIMLQPGESDTIIIKFHPITEGQKTGMLDILSDDPLRPKSMIVLKGFGGGMPVLSSSIVKIEYDTSFRLKPINDTTIIISNIGNLILYINSKTFVGPASDNFYFINPGKYLILKPGEKDTIKIGNCPKLPIGNKFARLQIISNDYINYPYYIDLNGFIKTPLLELIGVQDTIILNGIHHHRILFDNTAIDDTIKKKYFVANIGNDILELYRTFSDGDHVNDYNYSGIITPKNLAANELLSVTAIFSPLGLGERRSRIVICSNDPITPENTTILLGYGKPSEPKKPEVPRLCSPPNGYNRITSSAILVWKCIKNADSYSVQLSTDSLFSSIIINLDNVSDSSYAAQNLIPGQRYYWRISANNAIGKSDWSAIWYFEVIDNPPEKFTLISPLNNCEISLVYPKKSILFNWNKSIDIEGNEIRYSIFINGTNFQMSSGNIKDTFIILDIMGELKPNSIYSWYVVATDGKGKNETENWKFKTSSSVSDIITNKLKQEEFELIQNYPNPFNPSTNIKFCLPEKTLVTIRIYDVTGKEVAVLINDVFEAGEHSFEWYASGIPSGVYYYRLTAGKFTDIKKLILLK